MRRKLRIIIQIKAHVLVRYSILFNYDTINFMIFTYDDILLTMIFRFLCYLKLKLKIMRLLTLLLYNGMIFVIRIIQDNYTNIIAHYCKLQTCITLCP